MVTIDLKTASKLFINGEFVDAKSGETFALKNAFSGEHYTDVATAGKDDVEAAVSAAAAAQPAWAKVPAVEKAKMLRKVAQLIRDHKEEIGQLDMASMGKPMQFQFLENGSAAEAIEFYAALIESQPSGYTSTRMPGYHNMTVKEPYGVVAGIIPWNASQVMAAWKIFPAVAAGNAIVLKSSEKCPLSSAYFAGLAKEAGFPPGVINVLSGAGPSGQLLSSDMRIRKIAFTGSARTGKAVATAAAQSNLKVVTLELGGKSPAIVFDDADLSVAVPALVQSLAYNSGQICMMSSRLYVQSGIAKAFTEAYAGALASIPVGDPSKAETIAGPVADAIQAKTVGGYIETGKTEGRVLTGGSLVEGSKSVFQPTVFTDVDENASINKNEIFGPVSVLHTFQTEEEALERANDSEYGLYASVFTENASRLMRVARKLNAGTVGMNTTSPTIDVCVPFGGSKQSGIGRENGIAVLENWMETKALIWNLKE